MPAQVPSPWRPEWRSLAVSSPGDACFPGLVAPSFTLRSSLSLWPSCLSLYWDPCDYIALPPETQYSLPILKSLMKSHRSLSLHKAAGVRVWNPHHPLLRSGGVVGKIETTSSFLHVKTPLVDSPESHHAPIRQWQ